MMKQALADGTPRRAVFLNGVSYADEIGYRSLLEGWERSGEYPVTYIPTVSRAGRSVERRRGRAGPAGSRRSSSRSWTSWA